MECCGCLEVTDHVLCCGHHFCKSCSVNFIRARWHSGMLDMSCPLCRQQIDFRCKLRNNTPIFRYDKEIYFTISASGLLEQVEAHCWPLGQWSREESSSHPNRPRRLVRCHEARVLPLLVVNSVDKQERECQ